MAGNWLEDAAADQTEQQKTEDAGAALGVLPV
jgi:hypothetical protein